MMQKLALALMALSVAGCAGQPANPIRTLDVVPEGCSAVRGTWYLKVVYNDAGEPVGVASDKGNSQPIPDPARLDVRECDTVQINVMRGARGRSAMAAFDKQAWFRSPGNRPAYLSRSNRIVIPIDDRDGTGKEEFSYSVHVDCPESGPCRPLDPMIIVER